MENTVRNPLKHLAVMSVTGEECNAFLQGQLSSDLRELTMIRAQPSSLNSAKGRVLAFFQLGRFESCVVGVLPVVVAPAVVEHMSKFLLRTKAEIALDGDYDCFGIQGPAVNAVLAKLGAGAPAERDWATVSVGPDLVAWRVPGPVNRVIVAGKTVAAKKAYAALGDLPEADAHAWRLQDIIAGLPEILPPTQDKFVAQMLRLDDLGAISFNKGCYTGQEVIARAHYLGKVKRASATGCTAAKRPLKPAEVLEFDGKPAAVVVSAAPSPEGGQAVLAVLHGEHPPGTKFLASDGVEVTL